MRFFRVINKGARRIPAFAKSIWFGFGIMLIAIIGIECCAVAVTFLYDYGAKPFLYKEKPVGSQYPLESYCSNFVWGKDLVKEERAAIRVKWQPFVYWRVEPFKGKYINISDEGLRQTWNKEGSSGSQALSIFTFGNSTMWGMYNRDEYTIASYLSRMLSEEYGINVKVTNFGQIGYVSSQELIALLMELKKGNVPDLVIFLDGLNDIGAATLRRVGVTPNERHREEEFNLLNPEAPRFHKKIMFILLKETATYRILNRIFSWDLYAPPQQLSKAEVDTLFKAYHNNIDCVKKLGSSYGFKPLFYWQPVIVTKKNLTTYEKVLASSMQGIGHDLLVVTEESVARAQELNGCINISGVLDDIQETCYIDGVHYTEAANEIIARRMLMDIIPKIKKKANLKHLTN